MFMSMNCFFFKDPPDFCIILRIRCSCQRVFFFLKDTRTL